MDRKRGSIYCGADSSDKTALKTLELFRKEREVVCDDLEHLEPFFAAVENDKRDDVISFLKDKSIVNSKSNKRDGNTALHIAAEHNYVNMVRLLLDNGADSDLLNDFGLTPLSLAHADSESCALLALLRPALQRREALKGAGGSDDPFKDF